MTKIADKFKDRLKDKLKNHENGLVEKNLKKEVDFSIEELKDYIDFELINEIVTDDRLRKILKENTVKIFSIQSKAVIELGQIFENVYTELAKAGSKEGVYTKWLNLSGVAPRTALNYRKRYVLYSKANGAGKVLISKIPQRIIDLISSSDKLDYFIHKINSGITRDDLEKEFTLENNLDYIASANLPKVEMIQEFTLENYKEIFNKINKTIDKKIKEIDLEKQNEIKNYLERIYEILK